MMMLLRVLLVLATVFIAVAWNSEESVTDFKVSWSLNFHGSLGLGVVDTSWFWIVGLALYAVALCVYVHVSQTSDRRHTPDGRGKG